jgi:hypothetical protein
VYVFLELCGGSLAFGDRNYCDFHNFHQKMEFLTPSTPIKLPKTLTSINPCGTPLKLSSNYSTPEKGSNKSNKLTNSNQKSSSQKSSQKSDRFIPNRNNMDFSYCNYNLLCDVGKKENEDEGASNKRQRSSEDRLKEEVFQLANHTPGKRMLSCFDHFDEEPVTPVMKVSSSFFLY